MTLLVLGLGNGLLGDDGIGLLAAASLEGHLGSRVEIARSGRSGLYLVEELEGYDDAIILDSVLGEPPPPSLPVRSAVDGPVALVKETASAWGYLPTREAIHA